jgi:hypothetical protein
MTSLHLAIAADHACMSSSTGNDLASSQNNKCSRFYILVYKSFLEDMLADGHILYKQHY